MSKRKTHQMIETPFSTYTLLKLIGQGGAGRVWQASDPAGTAYAIKVLIADRTTTTSRKRFKNEIHFCQRASHPHLIRVHDYGVTPAEAGSEPFYVMPMMEGSLRTKLNAKVDPLQRLRYFDQLLSGVEAAHLQGVIHRDLKPENVLYDNSSDRMVVADFGIAHFTEEGLYTAVNTHPRDKLANFQYAAPEQRVRGGLIDQRTDLYALGLMLNELLTGHVPQGTGFKTVGSVHPELAWIDDVVDKLLQQSPDRRPDSVDAVKRLLQAGKLDFVERQRLSSISSAVIPVGEEDDPLALQPPQVVDFRWERGQLTLILDRPVHKDWVHSLWNISATSVLGKGPRAFAFNGNEASISADPHEVQPLINHFKDWLQPATDLFRRIRADGRKHAADRDRAALKAEQDDVELRRRLREQIRL